MNNAGAAAHEGRADWMVPELGFEAEIEQLRRKIAQWIAGCKPQMQDALNWQFLSGSKYFRPLTMFSCYRALHDGPIPEQVMRGAIALELIHNMTLVVDDILDKSDERRGKPTMHKQFNDLSALMVSGYMTAEAYRMMKDDPQAIELLSELITRLGVAECVQWDLRQTHLGVEDWKKIAQEDTGSMFEVAANLADRSGRLRDFGRLLGILYHGCDDVSDVRGTSALGGGGEEDIRDGILTLPASLAIRDSAEVSHMFQNPCKENWDALATAFRAVLPQAEAELDNIADAARSEANTFAKRPELLHELVDQTRRLSRK
jgi:geranylgeranyl diphosphate synthase type I